MRLTVVIPYYKRRFLGATLESLVDQSDQRFQVFIGDDASPEDPAELLRAYQSRLDLTYHRFAENLGGRSVVAQWNRCIRATQSDWVWLFSDDDIASTDCVAEFYETIANPAPASDVYRFQSSVIDETGRVLRASPELPPFESAAELALCRMLAHREFYVQNHIFSRPSFDRCGGMLEFPCGFFSEDASYAALGKITGVVTLPRGRVYWRQSTGNLNAQRPELVDQKLAAFTQYITWARQTFRDQGPAFQRGLRIGASSWIRRVLGLLGGIPSPRSQVKFYWFFLWFSPLRLPPRNAGDPSFLESLTGKMLAPAIMHIQSGGPLTPQRAAHTYDYVKNDSDKCLALCAERPATFLWHDCDDRHPGVVRFLLEWRALGRDVRRIRGTSLAYWRKS